MTEIEEKAWLREDTLRFITDERLEGGHSFVAREFCVRGELEVDLECTSCNAAYVGYIAFAPEKNIVVFMTNCSHQFIEKCNNDREDKLFIRSVKQA